MDISVIVCCYNSEKVLPETLRHLVNQKVNENLQFEVILVNNNSNDDTVEIARELWDSFNAQTQLTIVDEPRPGLSHARKKGVFTAKASLIVFCDDDNWLDENYLQIAYEFMKLNSSVGALGGQSIGVLEGDKPTWWEEKADGYAVGIQSEYNGDVTQRGFLWGAGIVIRKKILLNLFNAGFESLLLDRTGEELSSGGDSEFCKWIVIIGYQLWYLEELKFRHFIVEKRLSEEYVMKMYEGHYSSHKVLNYYDAFIEFIKSNEHKENKLLVMEGVLDFIKATIRPNELNRLRAQFKVKSKFKLHSSGYEIVNVYQKLIEVKN